MMIRNIFKLVIVTSMFFANQFSVSSTQAGVKKPATLGMFKERVESFFKDMFETRSGTREPLSKQADEVVHNYKDLCESDKKQADTVLKTVLENYVTQNRALINKKLEAASRKEWNAHLMSFSTIKGFEDEAKISFAQWKEKITSVREIEANMNREAEELDRVLQAIPNFMNNPQYKKSPHHKLLVDSLQKKINALSDMIVKTQAPSNTALQSMEDENPAK